MSHSPTISEHLRNQGISRREFLKFCTTTASLLALPSSMVPQIAQALGNTPRQSVIWLSFQECTACTESMARGYTPTLENLIFNLMSLDYHHLLQAATGEAAERALALAIKANRGQYVVIVDGSIPVGNPAYSTIAGISNKDMLLEVAKDAKAIIASGTCASYGGLPHANPNPTGAVPVQDLVTNKPVINVPGCPPVPGALASVLVYYITFQKFPHLDSLKRPLPLFGQNIHNHCPRLHFYKKQKFAKSFDDRGAKAGWCLLKLGCKGPLTYNSCATLKWNGGVSFPIESGHGCLGCSEPNFWDAGSFYKPLPEGLHHRYRHGVTEGLNESSEPAYGRINESGKRNRYRNNHHDD